jgi:alkylhydroperoxidase/carboxymuconolactone decarboxylase family protein YurZ
MKANDRIPSSRRLADANPEAMAHYDRMRAEVSASDRVDDATREIVLVAQFAVLGHEIPFKIHALRALTNGVTEAELRSMLMVGLGVTLVAFETARALAWLDEACATR